MVAGEQPPTPPDWRAPDDARELEFDRRAWRREERARSRRQRIGARLGAGSAWRLTLLCGFAALALVGVALVVLGPAGTRGGPDVAPLARPTVPTGSLGGLVPLTEVSVGSGTRSLRGLRPAALAVVGPECGCTPALAALGKGAQQFGLPVVLVVRRLKDATPLLSAVGGARAFAAVDRAGAVAGAYAATGLTAVLVRGDGVVVALRRDLSPAAELGAALTEASR